MNITIKGSGLGNAAFDDLDNYERAEWLLSETLEKLRAGKLEDDGSIILRDVNGNRTADVFITIGDETGE